MNKNTLMVVSSLVLTTLLYFFWWNNPFLTYLDYKIYDKLDHTLPSQHTPDSTVVVEIDDKSLKALGQWPWPRMISAKLIEMINSSNPSAIIMDVVFSEADRTSPIVLESFYHYVLNTPITIHGLPDPLRDNDAILAQTLSHAPMVFPVFSNTVRQSSVCLLPTNITYNLPIEDLLSLNDLVCNLPRFQQNSHPIGHIHASADGDGILRRISLAMRHDDILIPTLGVAAIASSHPSLQLSKSSPWLGESKLSFSNHHFFADDKTQALLTFYPPLQYEKISAVDILSGTINPERLKGKYVFIGSTALGLDSIYTMSDNSIRSGVYIHATMVENIINNDLRVQPSLYPTLNFSISLFISLLFLSLMLTKRYLLVLGLFIGITLLSITITLGAWQAHLYLSLGYLLIPLASYLFLLSMVMFIIDYRNKKRFIEALEKSEQEIQYQKAMLFQQSKLAAMGEMIDNIAHQWRQPLNLLGTIVQNSEFAFAKGRVDSTYLQKMSADSMEQILFMSQTIEDFRNFVKPDRQNIAFDLNVPVEESLRLLSGMFNSNKITIEVEYCDEGVIVMGSPSECKQVIINLLQNARDALLAHHPQSPYIHITLGTNDNDAIITIADNGGGIPSTIINQIFNPYFTTKKENGGSGIGLYICDAIIRTKMGGEITASTTSDRTLFTITLPLKH